MTMILRDEPTMTLADLADEADFQRTYASWGGPLSSISVHLDEEEPTIRFGEHEVPATSTGIEAIGSYVHVPVKFLGRVYDDEKQFILEKRIERSKEENVIVEWNTAGLREVRKASKMRISPADILETVIETMPEDSLVVEWRLDSTELLVDTIVPIDHTAYTGGDLKVGDITKGGLRYGQDRKQNLAPWVQGHLYRLRCTNGMEIPDSSLRIDARGMEEIEVLSALRQNGRIALDRIDSQIAHFYDLRSQTLGRDTTGALHRIARENDLPERTIGALEDALGAYLLDDFEITQQEEANMFHLVNFLTNFANSPDIADGAGRRLQRLGGAMVTDHVTRCKTCMSRLN